jgi:hypothetical protein
VPDSRHLPASDRPSSAGPPSERPALQGPTSAGPEVNRRRFLRKAVLGTAVLLTGPVASSRWAAAAAATATTKPAKKKAKPKKPSPTSAPTTVKRSAAGSTVAPSGAEFDATKELAVAFTYVPEGGRRILNPYVAVWVENADGLLIRTIHLTFQSGKGVRWLPDLREWWRADQMRILLGGVDHASTISSPTRVPGSWKVAWDGKTADGSVARQGSYVLMIEAAREKGPYELIRKEITIGSEPFEIALEPVGELQQASVSFRAKR